MSRSISSLDGRSGDHIPVDLLVRAIDDELATSDRIQIEEHLAGCDDCRARYRELGALSVRIEELVARTAVPIPLDARARMRAELELREQASIPQGAEIQAGRVNVWMRWGMALAATLVLGVVLGPHLGRHVPVRPASDQAASAATFDIDGETFVALPYSNPELPASSSRVVEMEVPVASLAQAGLIFEPVSDETSDRSVLADVLIGADGEPLGVHVITEP